MISFFIALALDSKEYIHPVFNDINVAVLFNIFSLLERTGHRPDDL
ncbi:hypothetical protein J2746_000687 [Methanolobus bombayensis]|nr:hypothetical protein [Methanolobus bombayensis]